SRPTYVGGLGFGFKWNMGWMNDTLGYFEHEPVHRRFHHHELTFSLVYAWNENFILPLSHDEVVHGKRSLLQKMPGDRWQQLANLRALYAYMGAPGEEAALHGRRARDAVGVDGTGRAAVGAARPPGALRRTGPCPRPQFGLPRRARTLGGGLLARGLPLARAERCRQQRARVHAALARRLAQARVHREPLAGAAGALPRRAA